MRYKKVSLAGAAAVVFVLGFGTVSAAGAARTAASLSFFAGATGPVANGSASWSTAVSNDGDSFSVQIEVPEGTGAPNFYSSFGGILIHHIDGSPPPAMSPTFDFYPTVTGASGGSPRLVINFSDGGSANLRPLAWVANTWTTEGTGATVNDWDNGGGSCGSFSYEISYAAVLACHPGATVTSAYVVSDSGWLYNGGYTNFIDNIQWNGQTFSQPSDNSNS